MALPVGSATWNVGPGGMISDVFKAQNALAEQQLKNRMQELQNQYYAPNIQSEIDQRNSLTQGQNITNQYLPEKLKLANQYQGLQNQYYGPNIQSEINQRAAATNRSNMLLPEDIRNKQLENQLNEKMNPLKITQQQQENQRYGALTPSTITEANVKAKYAEPLIKADIAYKNLGGGRGGVNAIDDQIILNEAERLNPNLSQDQLQQARDAYYEGKTQLADGTQLAPIEGRLRQALERVYARPIPAALRTANKKAEQANADIDKLEEFVQPALAPYGTTFLGYSPKQVLDTFKNDKESQTRLGKAIAAKALLFEISQARIRQAAGEPGVTTTKELIDLTQQNIKTLYPRLSGIAREESAKYMDKALKAGVEARNAVGLGRYETNKNSSAASNKNWIYNPTTGRLEEEK